MDCVGNDIVRTQLNYNYAERDGGQNFEWYGDGSDLTFTVKNEAHFDYLIQGDTLTLYTSDGSMYFTRIGGN